VAIVKATNHVECPPKERHLRSALIHSYYTLYSRVARIKASTQFSACGGLGIRSCLLSGRPRRRADVLFSLGFDFDFDGG
jgi:hypothetical protein